MERIQAERRALRVLAATCVLVLATGAGLNAATDNFDAYPANSSLIGAGNGMVSYLAGSPGGNPMGPNTTLTAQADSSDQEHPS